MDWLIENVKHPAIASISLGGLASKAMDKAVYALIRAGIFVVAAAGNEAVDSCTVSPSRVSEVSSVFLRLYVIGAKLCLPFRLFPVKSGKSRE